MPRLELKDWGGLIAIMLSLSGLVWNAAQQAAKNDEQSDSIAKLERVVTVDHDRLGRIEAEIFPSVTRSPRP